MSSSWRGSLFLQVRAKTEGSILLGVDSPFFSTIGLSKTWLLSEFLGASRRCFCLGAPRQCDEASRSVSYGPSLVAVDSIGNRSGSEDYTSIPLKPCLCFASIEQSLTSCSPHSFQHIELLSCRSRLRGVEAEKSQGAVGSMNAERGAAKHDRKLMLHQFSGCGCRSLFGCSRLS